MLRGELGVADDVDGRFWRLGKRPRPGCVASCPQREMAFAVQDQLRGDAAVDVHLVVALAVGLDRDVRRLKHNRDGRRGEDDLLEHLQGVRRTAGGDRAEIPDDGPARIEIGRPT